jgi:type II secretory pathway component GspD/PulD (secretin)
MKKVRFRINFWFIFFILLPLMSHPLYASTFDQQIMEIQLIDNQLKVNIKNTDLQQALEKVSQLSGINIYLDKKLKRNITTSFSGLSIEEGLKRIVYPDSYVMFYSKDHGQVSKEGILELAVKEVRIFPSGQNPIASEYIKTNDTKNYLGTGKEKNLFRTQDTIHQYPIMRGYSGWASRERIIRPQNEQQEQYQKAKERYDQWKKDKYLTQQEEAIESMHTRGRTRANKLRDIAIRMNDPQKWAEYYQMQRSFDKRQGQENALNIEKTKKNVRK